MKKKILAIGLVLVVLVTVFACGCLEDYYTSLDAADAKLTEAVGYIYAWSELIDQERFDAADAKLDGAVTAISIAEANVDDAKDMGAPKEETNEYDAAILYLKRWIFIGRSTTNLCKLIEEMDEKGYSEDINQKLIAETDKMLINLDTAEILGLNLIEKYPTIASELEVAKDIKDIKSLRKEYQDLKNMFLTVDEPVEVTKTTTPAPTPTRYGVITPTQIPTPTPRTSQPGKGLKTAYRDKIPSGVYSYGTLIEFHVTNSGAGVLKVTASSEISGYTDKAINTVQIASGETKTIEQTPLFKPGILDTLTELRSANLHYKVTYLEDGKETTWTEQARPVELYAKDTMIWGRMIEGKYVSSSPNIAAWVTPHVREVDELIRVAAEYHPQKSMGAAAAKTPEERDEQVKAIYNALQDYYEITYISASISYAGKTESSQRVKLPKDTINLASANCIDGTVLFASALESLRIEPYIVLIPDHAFLAWETGEAGSIRCLETTMVKSATFEEAVAYGIKEYRKEMESGNFETGVSLLVSIKHARDIGIKPMEI